MSIAPKLSFRTFSDILAMEVDESGYYLQNGLFTKGNPLTLVGPSEVGKTRFLYQFAACIITGREFLGMPVRAQPDMTWLIFQTENHLARLINDGGSLKSWLGPDWSTVDKHIIIHTLEHEHDFICDIADHGTQSLLGSAILDYKAAAVVFDPLQDFAWGNLNTDHAMRTTCQALAEFSRAGNPQASPVIIHHSLTGKQGIKKAVGFERASYGRGSKALHGWTRGQINLAPANSEGGDRIVVACGKNSNGRPFETCIAKLNPQTMIYEVDQDYTVADWHASLAGSTTSAHKLTVAAVLALLGPLPLRRESWQKLSWLNTP